MDSYRLKFMLWTLSSQIRPNIQVLAFSGPEMKVHRAIEASEYTEIIKTAVYDIEFTIEMNTSHLKYIL